MKESKDSATNRTEPAGSPMGLSLVSGAIVVLALLLMTLQAQAVFINVAGFSLSVYALILVSGLLVAGNIVLLFSALSGQISPADRWEFRRALLVLSPLLALSAYATIRLFLDWRLEGAQNLLALYVLTLSPLLFWLLRSWPEPNQLLRITSWVMGPTAVVYLVFVFADLQGFADRQFAMVALIGLAAATSLNTGGLVEKSIPYIIFFGIVASGSRTASAIALVMLTTLALRSAVSTRGKVIRIFALFFAGLGVTSLAYVLLGFTAQRMEERGTSGPFAEVITNSNGRFGAWADFLGLLRSPTEWTFGRGTGAAMEFGTANLAFFSHPHNEYIRYLVDLGILGLFLLAIGSATILFTLLEKKGFAQDAPRAATLTILALAGMSITDGPLYSSFVIIPATILVGAGLRSRARRA